MKRAKVERYIVVALFVMVLVVFSFAQRDTERANKLYADVTRKIETIFASNHQPASEK